MPARSARTRGLVVGARAKLNLGLAVGPQRADGFHDLVTVFQSVSLADTLIARPARRGFSLRVRREDVSLNRRPAPGLRAPAGRGNLVLRAARAVARHTGLEAGARFELIKRIPARSGLGGGSADAAAAIAALNSLYDLGISLERRREIALEIGSDVPFALSGGTALGEGRGEKLTRLRMKPPFRALIAVPRWGVSTAAAFARVRSPKYGLTAWEAKLRFARKFRSKGYAPERALQLGNTLEAVLGERQSEFVSLRRRLKQAGAVGVHMTGSGSAVFGLLEPGVFLTAVAARFVGKETLFGVRSMRTGLRIRALD